MQEESKHTVLVVLLCIVTLLKWRFKKSLCKYVVLMARLRTIIIYNIEPGWLAAVTVGTACSVLAPAVSFYWVTKPSLWCCALQRGGGLYCEILTYLLRPPRSSPSFCLSSFGIKWGLSESAWKHWHAKYVAYFILGQEFRGCRLIRWHAHDMLLCNAYVSVC